MPNNQACRVCGLISPGYFPWGESGNCASFEHCSCCGVMHGYTDSDVEGCRFLRKEWFASGCEWKYPEDKPSNWNLEEQLKNIPEAYI